MNAIKDVLLIAWLITRGLLIVLAFLVPFAVVVWLRWAVSGWWMLAIIPVFILEIAVFFVMFPGDPEGDSL